MAMGTKKPRLQIYLSPEAHQKLLGLAKNYTSVSAAIEALIMMGAATGSTTSDSPQAPIRLHGATTGSTTSGGTEDEVQNRELKGILVDINTKVESLVAALCSQGGGTSESLVAPPVAALLGQGDSTSENTVESPVAAPKKIQDGAQGISQKELIEKFKLGSSSNFSRRCKAQGKRPKEVLETLTGWRLQGRRWFPTQD